MKMWVQSLASLSGLRIWRCHELWCTLAAAAPTEPLAWEFPYTMGAALKKKKERKEKREGKKISVNVARHKAHPYMERNSFLPFHSFRKILVSACNLLSTVLEATYLYSIKRMHHSHRGGVIVTIFSEA